MNKAKYPDIVNEDGSIDYVTRITYDLQRLAVKRMTELCFGIPVKRIYKPNNEVLTKNAANTFEYENRSLPYSIKKYIEYNGEEQSITVFWNVEEYLSAGTYRVDIFADGTMIGSQRFELE